MGSASLTCAATPTAQQIEELIVRKAPELLDNFFEEVLHSQDLGMTYSLQAVAVHHGEFGTGHYVAFVRDSQDQWVLVDDNAPPVPVPFATLLC